MVSGSTVVREGMRNSLNGKASLFLLPSVQDGLWRPTQGKNLPTQAGDPGPIPESGRSSEERSGTRLQYSGLRESHGQRSSSGGLQRVGHD